MDSAGEGIAVERATPKVRHCLCVSPGQRDGQTSVCKQTGTISAQRKNVSVRIPWLPQQAKRVNDAVTTEAAFLLALALAAVTQNNTGMVFFAAEERGKAHFGEPCSWWQTEDVRLLAHLGATRGAFYSCEIVKHWTGKSCLKPGSLGVMSNFSAQCTELKEGWPQISGEDSKYSGPLSSSCNCGFRHQTLYTSKAQNFAVEAAVCAQFLKTFPRLPVERGRLNVTRLRGNGEFHFSPLADADSPGHFLFRQQPWLQAHWRAWQEQAGSKLNRTEAEREKIMIGRQCGKRWNGWWTGHGTVEEEGRASSELKKCRRSRSSGSTLTAQPGRTSEKFRKVVDSQSLDTLRKDHQLLQPRKS